MRIVSILVALIIGLSLCGCRKVDKDAETSSATQSATQKTELTSSTEKDNKKDSDSSKNQSKDCKHKFVGVTVKAGCEREGHLTQTCKLCGYSEKTVLKALGHELISGKCQKCDYTETVNYKKTVSDWVENSGGVVRLNDSRYYIRTNGGGNISFYFDNGDKGKISISVYSLDDNLCRIEYSTATDYVEGEFNIDMVHSSNPSQFFEMVGSVKGETAKQMQDYVVSNIDAMIQTFDKFLEEKLDISIDCVGFAWY